MSMIAVDATSLVPCCSVMTVFYDGSGRKGDAPSAAENVCSPVDVFSESSRPECTLFPGRFSYACNHVVIADESKSLEGVHRIPIAVAQFLDNGIVTASPVVNALAENWVATGPWDLSSIGGAETWVGE